MYFCFILGFKNNSLNDDVSDYYFRDSFEQSSELQLFDNIYHGYDTIHSSHLNRNHLLRSQIDDPLCFLDNKKKLHTSRKFTFIKSLIPTCFIIVIVILTGAIIMAEINYKLFEYFNSISDIVSLKYKFYDPFMQFFQERILY